MDHPIICFEGPSAIGKTSLSQLFSEKYTIVPEVNQLFERRENEPKYWYYERQIDRYQICKTSATKSILDGDIFQPIWYNWVCNYPTKFMSKSDTHNFYKAKLMEGQIAFPDLYLIFHIDERELRIRKEKDQNRQRRNFEKHLKIIQPLKEYYRFLDEETDIEMKFLEYTNIDKVKSEVDNCIDPLRSKEIDQLKAFEQITNWINQR